jgi:AraC-like DNA-binding protein
MDGAASSTNESRDHSAAADPGAPGMADVAAQNFRSNDPDETQSYLGQLGHHLKVLRGKDSFAYAAAGAASRRLTAVKVNVGVPQAMRAADSAPMLFLPLRTGFVFNIGRKAWQPDTSRAIFIGPDHEYVAHAPAGSVLGLRIDRDLLCREIAGRLRRRGKPFLLKSVELHIDAERKARLRAILQKMSSVAKDAGTWGLYGNVDTFEAEVASWLAGLVIEQAGFRAAPGASLQRVERLERWLDAHLGESITLNQLCAVSGVGGRTLQKLMLARFGQSPLEWVTARRLAAARTRLMNSGSGVAISMVALDCGLSHLGRFSAAYRRAHGELPSATLAAARSQEGKQTTLVA